MKFILSLLVSLGSVAHAQVVTGYQGYMLPSVAANILISTTESQAIDTKGFALVGFFTPAALTGTTLTFEACQTVGGTYLPVYDSTNTQVSITVATGKYYALDPKNFQGIRFLKIKSGSTELAARVINLSLKGF